MTAVEYLVEQLEKIGFSTNNIVEFETEVQIAKEMENQQIIAFAEWCLNSLLDGEEPQGETMEELLEQFKKK